MCTYFSFGLILRDIPYSITHQTTLRLQVSDSGRTARTPLYPPVQAVRPLLPLPPLPPPPRPGQRNRRRPVPVPVTGVIYNRLLWMCTLNTPTWPDLTSVASGNFPISTIGRALGHSNRGSVVWIPSMEVDLSVTFGADVGTRRWLQERWIKR